MPDNPFFSAVYAYLAIILFAIMVVYFRVAKRFNIIDKPNERSSHIKPTIRGGGVIFPIAILLFSLLNSFQYPLFALAVLLVGIVSFIDDIVDLSRLLRFGVHILAAILLLYQAGVGVLPIVMTILAFIFVVGVMNAFNFMDGINGITGFYSLAVIIPLLLTETNEVNVELLSFMIVALLVFLFFNARKKAKCFAGDVGSVSIAVIICFLLVQRIVATDDYKYLAFLTLYLVDTGLTIIQRAKNGEKVLEAHRKHLFQVLSNEMKIPHLVVALLFALLQLGINMLLINADVSVAGIVILFAVAIAIYIPVKIRLLKVASAEV